MIYIIILVFHVTSRCHPACDARKNSFLTAILVLYGKNNKEKEFCLLLSTEFMSAWRGSWLYMGVVT